MSLHFFLSLFASFALVLSAFCFGIWYGHRRILKQFMEVSKDPVALQIAIDIANHKFNKDTLEDDIEESVNYYRSKQKRDI